MLLAQANVADDLGESIPVITTKDIFVATQSTVGVTMNNYAFGECIHYELSASFLRHGPNFRPLPNANRSHFATRGPESWDVSESFNARHGNISTPPVAVQKLLFPVLHGRSMVTCKRISFMNVLIVEKLYNQTCLPFQISQIPILQLSPALICAHV